jgi:hypothetical protein
MPGWRGLRLVIFVSAALLSCYAHGAALETILMPGELVSGHARFETDCNNCHEAFSKHSQSQRCIECHDHENIAIDIKEKRGFHGRVVTGDVLNCKRCHSDHLGRDADIIHLDAQTFNHDQTDFALKDAHAGTRCQACHRSDKKYHEASTKCVECHKKQNPHKEELGTVCGDCHNEKSWLKTSSFNHDKTDFPLKGKHRDAACNSCHPNERYKHIAKICIACHRLNDVHRSRYGEKCQDCHAEKKWSEIHFDHDKDTKYSLKGRHRKVACDSCHKGKLYKDKTSTACVDCHRNDDNHKGQFGKKCADCHTASSWDKNGFNHDKDTKFKLSGRHKDLGCGQCHGGDIYKDKLKTDCIACHKKDDVHKEQQGKQCGRCHNEKSWDERIVFDHDVTHFPLIGTHAVTPCQECHLTASFKDIKGACPACHEKDDEHKGKLGMKCGSCHNPNGWQFWIFEHDIQTDFKLDGEHAKLNCHACHVSRVKNEVKLPKQCSTCHQRDDIHSGGFGPRCERCHDTEDFRHIRVK